MSGLIYGAIVVMWLAFLVPMWLKRHDDAVEAKSVDRFSTAMKVLARRTTAPDIGAPVGATAVSVPKRPADDGSGEESDDDADASAPGRLTAVRAAVTASVGSFVGSVGHRVSAWNDKRSEVTSDRADESARPAMRRGTGADGTDEAARPVQRRHPSAAVRRQRILVSLLALTAVMAVLAAVSVVPWLAAAVAGALLVSYVVLLRVMAVRGGASASGAARPPVRRVHRGGEDGTTAGALDDDTASYTVKLNPPPSRRGGGVPLAAPVVVAAPVAHQPLPVDVPTARSTAAGGSRVASANAAPDGFVGPRVGWDPVPVPSPTYVTAPRAPRAVRSIDLSANGAWTSGRLVADAKAAAAAAVAGSDEDASPTRRAVGD